MTDKLRAAAQAALEALETLMLERDCIYRRAINSLEAALAEPAIKDSLTVAEPVAWMSDSDVGFYKEEFGNYPCVPLYTAPPAAQPSQEPMHPEIKKMYEDYFDKCFRESSAPQRREWVSLTDEEIDEIYKAHHTQYGECKSVNFGYERAIEAKLREKNT